MPSSFTDAGVNTQDMGIQVLGAGQLDLHGAWFNPTWTRLATTAAAGQNWVSLQVCGCVCMQLSLLSRTGEGDTLAGGNGA